MSSLVPSNHPLLIVSGRSSAFFARDMTKHLGVALGGLRTTAFSDGELTVEIDENVRGRDVFVVQSTSTPVNDHLMELLIILDALRRASAYRVTAVLPYFGYSRQDRKTKPRVPITAKLVANLLTSAGADRVLTMDLHAGQLMGFFDIPVDNLLSLPVLLPYLKQKYGTEDLVVVSPDVGGVERARSVATHLNNIPLAVIDKRRSGPNRVSEMAVVGEVAGKTALLVDDMIDTGGTLTKAAETLHRAGATKVVAVASHGVFSGSAYATLGASVLSEVIVTDTIFRTALPPRGVTLSVAPLFAEAVRRIYQDDSVSSLFP